MNEISKAEMAGYLAVMMSWVPRDHQKEQIYRAIYAVIRAALRRFRELGIVVGD